MCPGTQPVWNGATAGSTANSSLPLTVYCRYFLYENREEDAVLREIVEKTENIYRELGGFGTVLGAFGCRFFAGQASIASRFAETCGMLDFKDPEEEHSLGSRTRRALERRRAAR